MPKLRVGVLFGGMSEEHPVSIKSAQEVAKHINTDIYEPIYIGINRAGTWLQCDEPSEHWEQSACRTVSLSASRPATLVIGADTPNGSEGPNESIQLDVMFPVLHGSFGEDGTIQGLLSLAGIPFVGCPLPASALCIDKSLTYLVAQSIGIATPTYRVVLSGDEFNANSLSYPVFVKPARSGSSFGVSKVQSVDQLPTAIETARRYDSKILVEEAVLGKEIGCAVLGNGADLITGEPDHIALSHGFFRIHQEESPEQGSDNAVAVVPAGISSEDRALVIESAKKLYQALGCQGLARVDLFLKDDGTVVLNEVNTMPGLTSYSRYPRMMAAASIPLSEVIHRVITLALTESGS